MHKKPMWAFLSVAFLLIFVPKSMAVDPPPERDIFTVAIIGDRTGGYPEGLKYLERAVYEINQLNPDFVVHIGDKVQGYTRDQSQWLREYEEFMPYMDKLNAPWYLVAGNHDVFSPIWDTNDRTYEELYKKHFGPIRYSFDYKNTHFVFLYTDDGMTSVPSMSDEQIEWLRNDLETTDSKNIFVFLHKPVWRYGTDDWDATHQVIKEFPVKAVIAGHFHTYQKDMNLDGIQYYTMGPTGGELHESDHELYGYFHHYNILRIEPDKFTMGVVKVGNVEADDYVLAEDCIKMRYAVIDRGTKAQGWLPQPVDGPVEGKMEITVHNALDVDMPVKVRLDPSRPLWSMEPPVLGFTLPAKSDVTAEVMLSSPRTAPEDIVPPEFEIEYTYTDAHGRKVPLTARRRVFLRDTHEIYRRDEPVNLDGVNAEPFWQQVSPLYNHTWVFSIYERHDAPPKMWLAADDTDLYFFVESMDDKYSYLKENNSRGLLSDAILFSTQPASGRREIIIFPFNDDGNAFMAKVDERGRLQPSAMSAVSGVEYYSRTDQQAGYYYCEGRIPLSLLFDNEQVMGKEVPFNVGVIDNDLTAFIYLRTWAYDRDPQYWGTLRFLED